MVIYANYLKTNLLFFKFDISISEQSESWHFGNSVNYHLTLHISNKIKQIICKWVVIIIKKHYKKNN